MSFIHPVTDDEAEGETAALYDKAKAELGAVLNLHRAFAHLPDLMSHFAAMTDALKARMGVRRYELVTIAAALELRSSYCSLAHAGMLMREGVDAGEIQRIAEARDTAELSEAEREMMAYAEEIARDAVSVSADRVLRLRELDLTDREISEIAAAAALRCFFSKYLDALGTLPDARFRDVTAELQSALVRGRPVEG